MNNKKCRFDYSRNLIWTKIFFLKWHEMYNYDQCSFSASLNNRPEHSHFSRPNHSNRCRLGPFRSGRIRTSGIRSREVSGQRRNRRNLRQRMRRRRIGQRWLGKSLWRVERLVPRFRKSKVVCSHLHRNGRRRTGRQTINLWVYFARFSSNKIKLPSTYVSIIHFNYNYVSIWKNFLLTVSLFRERHFKLKDFFRLRLLAWQFGSKMWTTTIRSLKRNNIEESLRRTLRNSDRHSLSRFVQRNKFSFQSNNRCQTIWKNIKVKMGKTNKQKKWTNDWTDKTTGLTN